MSCGPPQSAKSKKEHQSVAPLDKISILWQCDVGSLATRKLTTCIL